MGGSSRYEAPVCQGMAFAHQQGYHASPCLSGEGAKIITVKKGQVDFPNPSPDEMCQKWDHNRLQNSPTCHCEYDVERLQVDKAKDGINVGVDKINDREKEKAAALACKVESSNVERMIEFANIDRYMVSLSTFDLDYPQGGNGSCNGRHTLVTYDRSSGQPFKLIDVIGWNHEAPALLDALADDFIARYPSDEQDEVMRQKTKNAVKDYFIRDGLKSTDIYVEKGVVWVNVSDFMRSCAEGSLFPIRVPDRFISSQTAFSNKLTRDIHD